MTAEIVDVPSMANEVEDRISLQSLGEVDPGRMLCFDATDDDMAYGVDGRKSRTDLAPAEAEAVRKFCGPCSQQEPCLARAIMSRNKTKVVEGGLNAKGRYELLKFYDKDDKSIPRRIWDIAIEAVLEGDAPYFPGQKGGQPKAPIRRRILEYLADQPDMTFATEGMRNVYGPLATEVKADEIMVRAVLRELAAEKIIRKQKLDRYLVSISLAA